MLKKVVYLLVLILVLNISYAATLHGMVYDYSLEKVSDVVIEVDSSPVQRIISKQGEYQFDLAPGKYIITAKQVENSMIIARTKEEVSIDAEGDYVLDLFLFPSFEEEESLLNETDMSIDELDLKTTNYLLTVVIILLIAMLALLLFIYFKSRKQPKTIVVEGADDAQKVLSIIRSQGGRTTQKQIRKHMPLSEAKVSLIITELEAKGIVQKIKKGRGNIIILKN